MNEIFRKVSQKTQIQSINYYALKYIQFPPHDDLSSAIVPKIFPFINPRKPINCTCVPWDLLGENPI